MCFFNRYIVLFATLFISVVASAQSDTLRTKQEYERKIRESEQFIIEKTATSTSVIDGLFKPIDDQVDAFRQQQQWATKLRVAEYILLAVLITLLITLLYVFLENVRNLERTRALQKQKATLDKLLGKMLPEEYVQEYLETGQISPTICADSLVVMVELLVPSPLPLGMNRIRMLEEVLRENERLTAAHGLVKIKFSGDRLLSVCKSHKRIPLQQFECTMAYVSSFQEALNNLGNGVSIRSGMSYGNVLFGAVGTSSIRVDLLGSAVDEAAKCCYHGAPGETWITDQVKSRLGQNGNYKAEEHVAMGEMDCTMMKITAV